MAGCNWARVKNNEYRIILPAQYPIPGSTCISARVRFRARSHMPQSSWFSYFLLFSIDFTRLPLGLCVESKPLRECLVFADCSFKEPMPSTISCYREYSFSFISSRLFPLSFFFTALYHKFLLTLASVYRGRKNAPLVSRTRTRTVVERLVDSFCHRNAEQKLS